MLDRRKFGIGAAAAASTLSHSPSLMGALGDASTSASWTGIPPLPVEALQCCNSMVQENARRLEHIARDVHRLERRFADDPAAREAWPRLYEDMVDEAWGLREKGIMGRSPLEQRLLDWVNSIVPDDETYARQPRATLSNLSASYESAHRALEHQLAELARQPHPTSTHTRAAFNAAWNVVNLVPETLDDREAHRLAINVLFRDVGVFVHRDEASTPISASVSAAVTR